ncbi:MAG: leucine-rich repeat protein, partial [Clostridiales bacterium]|nr:leucine-rich repeat protein [Clostridiales bacterium]
MRRIKRFISLLLAFCLVLSAIPTAAFAADETATVTVNVTYKQTEARSMLEMINDFRTGDDAWAWDSSDTEQVYYTGLSELTYDYDLEAAAMQRAAEIALSYSHTRPDGTSCFTAYSWSNCGENIAAGTSLDTAEEAFALWQETDKSYSGQGHRRNMLSASFTAVAVACVYYNGCYYWVQEFRRPASSQAATTVNDNATDVDVEIALSDATVSVTPSAASLSLTVGETTSLPALTIKLQMSGAWPSRSGPVSADAEWTVGDESCVTLSDDGTVTAEATGNTTLTATVLGEAVTVSVIVTEAVCEHTYDSGVVTAEPTCTAEGVKTYTCTQCGATYTEAVAALGHVYTATDNGDGTHTQACSRCSSKVTATHSYSVQQYNWAGDYSSCTADFACDECDAAETVECAVTGDVTTAPTCTTSGRATYTASASLGGTTASQKKAVTLAATGHTYVYADNGDGTHTVSCAQGDLTASNESCTYEGGVCVCCGAAEPESSTVVASGVCGDDLTWVLDEDGTLTISGTGDMTLFEENSAPWYAWREQIVAVVLESGVKSVGNYAFYGCTALKTVSLPNSVTCLCYSAFYGCTGLTKVVIPDSVTDIGDSAFFGCTNLADVTIGSSVTEIRAYVFAYTALSNVIIPEGVTDISEYAFHCAALTSVTIPESVISIGTGAFSYCVGLTDVYYAGSKADWAAISIGSYNTYLENATIHYTETTITELTAPTITSLYNATNGVSVGWD